MAVYNSTFLYVENFYNKILREETLILMILLLAITLLNECLLGVAKNC